MDRVPSPSTAPLIPRQARPSATVVVLVAVAGFAALAARYAGGSDARWLDDRAEMLVQDITPRSRIIVALIELGSPLVVVTVAVLTAAVCLSLRRPKLAVLAVLGPGLTGVATTLAKPVVGRTLDGYYAYPSGHTGGATAMALVAAVVLVAVLRPQPPHALVLILGTGLLVGATWTVLVVAVDYHYATDAVGGTLVAVAAVLGSALLIDAVAEHRPAYARRG